MNSLGLLLIAFGLANANPIVVEPVNPAVANGISKVIESPQSQSIPLANSVQSVPSPVPVSSNVQAVVVEPAPVVASNPAPVEPVVAAAPVPVASVVVPSTYVAKEVVAPVVPQVGPVVVEDVSNVQAAPVAPVVKPVVPVPSVAAAPVVDVQSVPVVEPVVPIIGSKVIPAVAVIDPIAEKNSADPSAVLSGPIDQATKLVIDLDEHIKKYLPAEDEIATTLAPHIYSGDVAESEAERQQNQMSALIDQVNRLAESIENTITDLVARRRYVTAAMLRSMLNYVRRVRVNLERLQNRLQSVQAVATSGQNSPPGSAPAGSNIPGAAFFNTIRDRINRMTEEIGALVTRIRGSFTPGGSVVSTSPLPPLVTAANLENIGAAAAAGSIVSAINTVNAQPQNVAAAVVVAQAA